MPERYADVAVLGELSKTTIVVLSNSIFPEGMEWRPLPNGFYELREQIRMLRGFIAHLVHIQKDTCYKGFVIKARKGFSWLVAKVGMPASMHKHCVGPCAQMVHVYMHTTRSSE